MRPRRLFPTRRREATAPSTTWTAASASASMAAAAALSRDGSLDDGSDGGPRQHPKASMDSDGEHRRWLPPPALEFVGLVHAIGAVASMVGVLIYHKYLKNYPFRSLLFYAQLLYGVSGLLDLTFVLRWNLALGIPDAVFVTVEESVSRVVGRVRLMPMMVLSTKLCPPGVEGTFFALLMCIDSVGMLTAKAGGAAVLRALRVTRTDFGSLWLAVLVRNVLRLATLAFIFLVPTATQTDELVPREPMGSSTVSMADEEDEEIRMQLVRLTSQTDDDV